MPNGDSGPGLWDDIFSQIRRERLDQIKGWGDVHDDEHTPLNWVGLIAHYSSRWVRFKFNPVLFRDCMIKAAALCLAAINYIDRKLEGVDEQ